MCDGDGGDLLALVAARNLSPIVAPSRRYGQKTDRHRILTSGRMCDVSRLSPPKLPIPDLPGNKGYGVVKAL